VNRQIGGEKLKYEFKILHRGAHQVTLRMRNDDSASYLWALDVWGRISRKPLEIGLKARCMVYCESMVINRRAVGIFV